jgi:hypothetical protein
LFRTISQMGSACSRASAAVPSEPQLRGQEVKRRAVYSSLPANTGLETGLPRGFDTTPTRRDSSQRSSGRRDSLPVQFSRSAEQAGESNPEAGLDTSIRRLSSNPETPHGLVQRKVWFGADDVIQPGTSTAMRRGLTRSAPTPTQPATSKVWRANLRPPAPLDSTLSRGSISPERRLSLLLALESRIAGLESRLVEDGEANLADSPDSPPRQQPSSHRRDNPRRSATITGRDSMRPRDGLRGKRNLLQPPSPISPERLSSIRESLKPQEKSAFFRPPSTAKGHRGTSLIRNSAL